MKQSKEYSSVKTARKTMTTIELIGIIKEVGLAASAMGLCIWIVITIVKRLAGTVDKLCGSVDKLSSRVETSTDRTRMEHEQLLDEIKQRSEEHKEFTAQQREITASLGRINGFKA